MTLAGGRRYPRGPTSAARRTLLAAAIAVSLPARAGGDADRRWIAEAERQRERALGWGDQPYGAVLVLGGRIVGEGPSRVVQRGDADAHAERVALADARQRLGAERLAGSTLYSTSRPCRACERAAAEAGVARLVYGADAFDGGPPQR